MKILSSAFYFIYKRVLALIANELSLIKDPWVTFVVHAVEHYCSREVSLSRLF